MASDLDESNYEMIAVTSSSDAIFRLLIGQVIWDQRCKFHWNKDVILMKNITYYGAVNGENSTWKQHTLHTPVFHANGVPC